MEKKHVIHLMQSHNRNCNCSKNGQKTRTVVELLFIKRKCVDCTMSQHNGLLLRMEGALRIESIIAIVIIDAMKEIFTIVKLEIW